MAQTLVERLTASLEKEELEPRTKLARNWLIEKTKNLKVSRNELLREKPDNLHEKTLLGHLYYFFYDPKLKKELPYYDRFPLVIPIEKYSTGFLGINLHYISPKYRIKLLNKLSVFLTDNRYDEDTKFRLSYHMLNGFKNIKEFRPCLKQYLYTHVESLFLQIPSKEWDIAILLGTEFFMKEIKTTVWRTSEESM